MKQLILAFLFVVMSVITVNATNNTNFLDRQIYTTELSDSINQIHIAVPCRVIYGAGTDKTDTTFVMISDATKSYKVYHMVKNNVLYIKSDLTHEQLFELEQGKQIIPIVRIMIKQEKQPEITTGSGFNKVKRNYEKATKTYKN